MRVEVTNTTPQSNGSRRKFFLGAYPDVKTAKEAVEFHGWNLCGQLQSRRGDNDWLELVLDQVGDQ
jgi:hypothetical protein